MTDLSYRTSHPLSERQLRVTPDIKISITGGALFASIANDVGGIELPAQCDKGEEYISTAFILDIYFKNGGSASFISDAEKYYDLSRRCPVGKLSKNTKKILKDIAGPSKEGDS